MTKRPRLHLLGSSLVALALGLTACQDETTTGQTASVAGVVTDDVGAPVVGATVAAVVSGQSALSTASDTPSSTTTTTGSDGAYSLECPEGTASISVSKEGFATATDQVQMRGRRRRGPGDRGLNFDMPPGPGGDPMARMDTDGNGEISAAEWKGAADFFLKIDADASGGLTAAELEAARTQRRARHPRHGPMDSDGNGVITATEWLGPSEVFTVIDTSGDGTLSKAELDAALALRGTARFPGAPPPQ